MIGRRLKLEFAGVNKDTFSARRISHHRELQEGFFSHYRITGKTVHHLRRGEAVWQLTHQRYKVPVWLLRQYNPDLDLNRVKPEMEIVFPHVEIVEAETKKSIQ